MYYFDGELSVGFCVRLEGDEFHHLAQVMRAKVGEKICLFNGNGTFYFGEIVEISKKYAKINILTEEKSKNEPKVHLTVFQALVKGDKLSLIMQKITELGASELVLFESKFCDVKASSNKEDKMNQISVQACKQCKRASIVKSSGVLNISEIADQIKDFDAFFVAYENKDGHLLTDSLIKLKKANNIAIMIGAEGGFAEDEIDMLEKAGADIVSLGNRILRTETAAIACTTLITGLLEK